MIRKKIVSQRSQTKCLNCGTICHDDYCPKCGQKTSTHRFQLKEISQNFIYYILGGDSKIWRTCSNLITRPGHMVREYLLGKRVSYYAPVRLLFFLVALYAIIAYFITGAISPFDIFRPNVELDYISSSSAEKFLYYFQKLMGSNVYFALYAVVINLIPFRIVFRKCKLSRPSGTDESLNIAEHFFVLVYQSCFTMILAFVLLPLIVFDNGATIIARISIIMPTIYCIILYKQILGISLGKSIWLNIKAQLLSVCINLIIIMLIFGILYGIDCITG